MEDSEVEPLIRSMERRIDAVETEYHRPLYHRMDWDDRLVCIKGAKGTGKTTMLLQYLKEHPAELDSSMYISLDSLWFANNSPCLLWSGITTMEACGGRALVGNYYGYFFGMPFRAEGWHLETDAVLDSPYVDFLCSPYDYAPPSRGAGNM